MSIYTSVFDAIDDYDDFNRVGKDILDIYSTYASSSEISKKLTDCLSEIALGIEDEIIPVRNHTDWKLVPCDFLYDPIHKNYYLEYIASKGFIDCRIRLYSPEEYFVYPYSKNETIDDETIEKFKQAKSLAEKLDIYEEKVNN